MADVESRCNSTNSPTDDSDAAPRRGSTDPPEDMTTITESPSMSRSSSKASSIDTTGKTRKPRKPQNYAERKSSITTKRPGLSGQLKNLNLNQAALHSSQNVLSPPASANTTPNATFTPILESSRPLERNNSSASRSTAIEIVETPPPYYTLPLPIRPADEVPKAPATQMYWHQPPIHGMMPTGPMRRSHAIAQIGSSFYIFGGSDALTGDRRDD